MPWLSALQAIGLGRRNVNKKLGLATHIASVKHGEENTHPYRQRQQLENEGQLALSVLHCKLCAPHKGLVIVRPLPPLLLLLSPTLLQWDKEQLAIPLSRARGLKGAKHGARECEGLRECEGAEMRDGGRRWPRPLVASFAEKDMPMKTKQRILSKKTSQIQSI